MPASKAGEDVYLVDSLAMGQAGTVAVYVVRGSKVAVIDSGYASSHQAVLDGLGELGILPSEVDYLIPTHVHLDHAGGAGHLLSRMPRAKVYAQEKGVPHLVDPTRLVQSATMVFGEDAIRAYGKPMPIPEDRITAVGEEAHLDLGGLSLTMVHSPGHAPHQMSVMVEGRRLMLPADAVGIVYPSFPVLIPTTPPPSLDPTELARSIDRLSQMDSARLLVPHYGVREDVENVYEATKRRTAEWVKKAEEMKRDGMNLDAMVKSFKRDLAAEAGIPDADVPEYVLISIRTSMMGIARYLEKNPSAKP